ncbi:MAG: hypothetical protein HY270_04350, partial [Deltaproteobacteria bacterium]|nr:hypothetical protein [Deltaproteobacteria bacterium]
MVKPVVGKAVDSWCAACKLMLAHTIEAVVNEKITRTHCNTCGAQHAYRPNPPGTATKARRTSTTTKRTTKATPPPVDYEALLRGKDPSKARAYKTSERFLPKEVINHPVFGLGLV